MYLINELNCTDEEFKDKFRIVWNQIKLMNPFLEAEESPEGFVLGGQPGAGKNNAHKYAFRKIEQEHNFHLRR